MYRILANTPATLAVTFFADGVATDPTPLTVTVTATRADGTVVLSNVAATRISTGTYEVALPAQADPDRILARWASTNLGTLTTSVEIVGGFYAALDEIRSSDASLSHPNNYPWALLDASRSVAEDEAERIMGRAFVRRWRRDRLPLSSNRTVTTQMAHVRRLRQVAVTHCGDTVTVALGDCKIVGDRFVFVPAPEGSFVELSYEHGLDEVPFEVARAVLIRCRQIAQRKHSGVPESSQSWTINELGAFRHSHATTSSTGQKAVDAVYDSYSLRVGIG